MARSYAKYLESFLEGFVEDRVKSVFELPLKVLEKNNRLPPNVEKLWNDSTTTWPRILDSGECWETRPPEMRDIVMATFRKIDERQAKEKAVAAQRKGRNRTSSSSESDHSPTSTEDWEGEEMQYETWCHGSPSTNTDSRTAIAQLIDPNCDSPVSLLGLNLSILPPGTFHPPAHELSRLGLQPMDEACQQLLLTPKYNQTDLHIDTSDGCSLPLGKCEKLWICYPPTKKNLERFTADGASALGRLGRMGRELEGGICCITDGEKGEAIFLPVGCIHTVFTLQGGYLVAVDFNTRASAPALATLINSRIDREGGDRNYESEIWDRFLTVVDLALHETIAGDIMRRGWDAWVLAGERIGTKVQRVGEGLGSQRDGEWIARAEKMWCRWFDAGCDGGVVCGCGFCVGSGSIRERFLENHGWRGMLDGMRKGKAKGQEKRKTTSPARKSNEEYRMARCRRKEHHRKLRIRRLHRRLRGSHQAEGQHPEAGQSPCAPEPRTAPQQAIIEIDSDISDLDDDSNNISQPNPTGTSEEGDDSQDLPAQPAFPDSQDQQSDSSTSDIIEVDMSCAVEPTTRMVGAQAKTRTELAYSKKRKAMESTASAEEQSVGPVRKKRKVVVGKRKKRSEEESEGEEEDAKEDGEVMERSKRSRKPSEKYGR